MGKAPKVVLSRRTNASMIVAALAVWAGTVGLPEVVQGNDQTPEVRQTPDVSRPASTGEVSTVQPALMREARSFKVLDGALQPAMELMSAERLQLRVHGYPELSGEYRINPDNTIAIAGLRRVPLDAISLADLEVFLTDRLSTTMRRDVLVSVEVSRFRPYFVTGQVATPGAVEWRPGLTLIQAISLAGGISRQAVRGEESPERALVHEQNRAQLRFANAQLARVKAEKSGQSAVDTAALVEGMGDLSTPEATQSFRTFLDRQNQLLAEQRDIMRGRVTRLEREREIAAREFETARQQEQEIAKTVDMSKELADSLTRLKDGGLITMPRYLGQQRDLIETRVRYGESRAQVERARGRVASLTREIETVQQERRAFLNDRIESLEREIAQLELSLRDARPAARPGSQQEAPASLSYFIARNQAHTVHTVSGGRPSGGVQTVTADLFTEILPGDVVIVASQSRGNEITAAALGAANTDVAIALGPLERTQRIIESSAALRTQLTIPQTVRTSGQGIGQNN